VCVCVQNGRYGEEGFAGPAVDGSEEAEQVNKFLEKENEAFQRPGVFSSGEELGEGSEVELQPITADSEGEQDANKDLELQIESDMEVRGGASSMASRL